MLLTQIQERVNHALAGERLSYDKMIPFLDRTVDDINNKLGSIYPVFSELPQGSTEYTYFADRWIRMVVIIGAAYYFFVMDEEGIASAPQYQADYYNALNEMQRLAFNDVPEQYIRQTTTGIDFSAEADTGERGVTFDGTVFLP